MALFPDAVKTTINLVVYTVTPTKTTVAFSKPVNKEFVTSKVSLWINNETVNGEWTSCAGNQYDVLWILKHSKAVEDVIDVKVLFEVFATIFKNDNQIFFKMLEEMTAI